MSRRRRSKLGDRRTIGSFGPADWTVGTKPEALRAQGEARLRFKVVDGRTRTAVAYQAGCLRARFPTTDGPDLETVLINTGGGITGGDILVQSIAWEAGARALVTTPAAEKVYRSVCGEARVETHLDVGPGALAEWLPQETIFFDDAALRRDITVDMAGDARFLGVEAVIFGRAAMGESVRRGALRDRWRIRRGGRLVYADAQNLSGPVDQLLDRAAIGAGARAMGVVIYAAPAAASLLDPARRALLGGRGAASERDGVLVARLLAPDGKALREGLVGLLEVLRGGRRLPRMWKC